MERGAANKGCAQPRLMWRDESPASGETDGVPAMINWLQTMIIRQEQPMASFERLVSVNAPSTALFAGITALERIPEWIPDIKRAYLTSSPPVQAGTTFVQDTVFLGWSFPIAGEVVQYRPVAEFGYVYSEGIVAGVWNYEISPVGQNAAMLLVTIDFIEGAGLAGLLRRLLRPLIRVIISHNLDRLRHWVEQGCKCPR
jgi:hypothetical protein